MEQEKNDITTENQEQPAGDGRDEQGRWVKGVSGNPDGAKPLTEEERIKRKATKEFIEEYKSKLAEALPKIEPVLVAKAIGGDITAIKEINDRVMGKPENSTTFKGDENAPIIHKFEWKSEPSQSTTNQENGQNNSTTPTNDGM